MRTTKIFLVVFIFSIFLKVPNVFADDVGSREGDKLHEYPVTPGVFYENVNAIMPINNTYTNDVLVREIWNQGYKGKGVKIAIIDSGVDSEHPDLKISKTINCISDLSGCFESYADFDSQYHGTHVTGIINAQHNNGIGIDGIAPSAEMYVLSISSYKDGHLIFNNKAYVNAIKWARENDVDIINFSMGFDEIPELTEEINKAIDEGILFVASASNDGRAEYKEKETTVDYPGTLDGVIAVSNVNNDLKTINVSSSIGKEVFIGAPGEGINSTFPRFHDTDMYTWEVNSTEKKTYHIWDENNPEGYQQLSGTSQAAPIVAGILALLKEKYPTATSEELKDYLTFMAKYTKGEGLKERIDEKYNRKRNDEFGFGVVQAEIGKTIEKNITIKNEVTVYNLPNEKYKTELSLAPQTVSAIREGEIGTELEGWFEVKTNLGYRWIKPENYHVEVRLALTTMQTVYLYEDETGKIKGELDPQTHDVTRKKNNMFYVVNSELGEGWISPQNYTIGIFELTIHNSEKLYDTWTGYDTGMTVSKQTLEGLHRHKDGFFTVNVAGKGMYFIKPSDFSIQYSITLDKVYPIYDGINGIKTDLNTGPITYKVKERDGDWFKLDFPNRDAWIKPNSYIVGDYYIRLLKTTSVYEDFNDYDSLFYETSYPLKVYERRKGENGTWFLIESYFNTKMWINPEPGTFVETQDVI